MADKKISQLDASTTPLAGTEELPIVQSSTTKRVTVANLTAGRNVAALKLQPTDNVEVASGKGIDFAAAGGNVLTQYKEGTWTPVVTSTIGTITTVGAVSGTYTRTGRTVYITYDVSITTNGTGAGAIKIEGLPFTLSKRGFGVGVEADVTGALSLNNAIAGTTYVLVTTVTGLYPGGSGYHLLGDFSYDV